MYTKLMPVKKFLKTCSFHKNGIRLFKNGTYLRNNIQEEKETHFGFTNVKVHEKSEKVYKVFAGNKPVKICIITIL